MTDQKAYRTDFIKFYHLRSYDRLNAPYGRCCALQPICHIDISPLLETYLKEVEQRSGVSVYEAQVAQAREWIGEDWQRGTTRELKIFETKGNVGVGLQMEGDAKKSDAKVKTLPLPQDPVAAKRTVDHFEDTAKDVLGNFRVSDNVGQHAMRTGCSLLEEGWYGTEEEERNWCVHSSLHHPRTDHYPC
jgi:phospholipase D1/2